MWARTAVGIGCATSLAGCGGGFAFNTEITLNPEVRIVRADGQLLDVSATGTVVVRHIYSDYSSALEDSPTNLTFADGDTQKFALELRPGLCVGYVGDPEFGLSSTDDIVGEDVQLALPPPGQMEFALRSIHCFTADGPLPSPIF